VTRVWSALRGSSPLRPGLQLLHGLQQAGAQQGAPAACAAAGGMEREHACSCMGLAGG
jgi:hypothetical protein